MRLTDVTIRNLDPPERGQKTYFDDAVPGFAIRISQGGSRSFILQTRNPRRLVTLGRYHPQIFTLADARQKARNMLARKQLGQDAEPEGIPFAQGLEQFLEAYRRKNKTSTADETERLLRKHLAFKGDAAKITTRDLTKIVDAIKRPSAQHHLFVAVKTLFNWLAKRKLIPSSPMAGLDPPNRPTSRDRVLSEPEIVQLWSALDGHHSVRFRAICRLLLLSGQRLAQIAALRAEWIDYDAKTISFPASVMKGGIAHQIPYGPLTASILDELPKQDLLFPTSRGLPYNNWSTATESLRKICSIEHFTLHDLRRTWTSLAARTALPHVLECVLAHKSGTISGVAAIYNRHRYMEEMRAAMLAFEETLSSLLNP